MPEEPRDFLLADLGEGLEEATIVEWLVEVGDSVALNQPLCVVETAKAEVEIPSPHAGEVVALGGDAGDTLRVGTLLARFAPSSDAAPARQSTLVGYGHDASLDRSRRSRRAATAGATTGRAGHGSTASTHRASRPLAKPPVRLLARRLGVDLTDLAPGSGPGGVVTRADVEAAAEPKAPTVPTPDTGEVPAGDSVIPVQGIRARVAERMATSRARIPDATASVVADCTRLLEVRAGLNAHAERQGLEPVVTPFSLLCRLVVQTLGNNPLLNSSFDEAGPEIKVHGAVHLGIGTATDRGLVVTVVHDAHQRAVHDLSVEMARLAEGARAGTLSPGELSGSTFTVSNFGALGLDDGIPIVNHPEAAILGVGSIRPRPHVVDGDVVARPTASLTLAFDHRVCDGAEAASFMTGLRDLVEAPELALLGS
jgi:2-oxoisovalerate dehydrogenase E2 component (dihydrolipoyl transacylase)